MDRVMDRNLMMISIDSAIAFNKVQHLFVIKSLK